MKSYIRTFVIPDDILFNEIKPDDVNMYDISGVRVIDISATLGEKYSFYNTGEKKQIYDGLCLKYGDTSFNRIVNNWETLYIESLYFVYFGSLGVDIAGISIFSDSDFDEQHLAYTDLRDIVSFTFVSTYKFITSGYQLFPITGKKTYYVPWYSFNKKVSMLEGDDLKCLGMSYVPYYSTQNMSMGALFFPTPTLSQTHNITITLIADDGRVFEDTLEVSWE